jgi:hypothetical protein
VELAAVLAALRFKLARIPEEDRDLWANFFRREAEINCSHLLENAQLRAVKYREHATARIGGYQDTVSRYARQAAQAAGFAEHEAY